jgi:hypothetical protein
VYRLIFASFWIVLFAYVLREGWFAIRLEEERAAIFPLIVGIPSLLLSALAFGREFVSLRRSTRPAKPRDVSDQTAIRKRAVEIIAWIAGFFVAIWLLGFNIAVPVATLLFLRFGSGERWQLTVTITVFSWVFFYGLFDYTLHLPFPEGQLLQWVESYL